MWFSVVILSTTIRIITVVNKFLTTVMTRIVVDKITTLSHIRFGFLLQYEHQRKWVFFRVRAEKGIACGHIDASNVVWTFIDNCKLDNQIARLVAIVVKILFSLCRL